jgi:hypothetical protein
MNPTYNSTGNGYHLDMALAQAANQTLAFTLGDDLPIIRDYDPGWA